MFTLTSVLFLHNKWQQNEHDTHFYDSSLWKYSTHQTCFAMYQSTKNIYNCNCENREKHQRKHKSPICCICAWKSAYCVRTEERRPSEGGRDDWVWWLPLQCWWNSQQTQRRWDATQQYTVWSRGNKQMKAVDWCQVNSDKLEMSFSMWNKDQSSLIMRINFTGILRSRNDHDDFIHLDNK